jgi:hypothetical protein
MSETKDVHYKPEDIYEPEMATDDDNEHNVKQEKRCEPYSPRDNEGETTNKRKRKSRWGDKDPSIPPPTVILNTAPAALPPRPGALIHQTQCGKTPVFIICSLFV